MRRWSPFISRLVTNYFNRAGMLYPAFLMSVMIFPLPEIPINMIRYAEAHCYVASRSTTQKYLGSQISVRPAKYTKLSSAEDTLEYGYRYNYIFCGSYRTLRSKIFLGSYIWKSKCTAKKNRRCTVHGGVLHSSCTAQAVIKTLSRSWKV